MAIHTVKRCFYWLVLPCFLLVFLGYCALIGGLFFKQSSLIFPGTRLTDPDNTDFTLPINTRSITIPSTHGATLKGWHIANAHKRHCSLIYFGGNAEDVRTTLADLSRLNCRGIYTFNYRGYGDQQGLPSETVLFSDAQHIFDHVNNQSQSPVYVMGFSMGSAVAGHLAAKPDNPINKLALLGALESIHAAASYRYGNIIPEILIQHPFKLVDNADKITSPTLLITTLDDATIPNSQSLKTYARILAEKTHLSLSGVGHSELFNHPKTIPALNAFFEK